jgi:putative hemolysin
MENIASEDIFSLTVFCACLVASAMFSASETAITSLGVLKTKHLIESRESDAGVLKFWLRHPSRVLTTILIFNTLVNALASAVITDLASRHFDHAIGVATGAVTFFVLIFGEVLPKSFARANSEPMAPLAMRLIRAFYFMFYPAVVALSEFANWVIRLLGSKEKFTPNLTEEELEFIINEGTSSGVMEDLKKDMLSGVFEFDETKVSEIMTPRPDVVAISKNANFNEALRMITESGHSRLPVFDERIDNVIGVLFAKDLLRHLTTKGNVDCKLTTLLREPFFTPESKPIMDVFKDLKRTKNHMSVVIDEYGGMAGIVTMEDILEEIVGEIQDEFDAEEAQIVKLSDGVFDVAGTYNVEEFREYFKLEAQMSDEDHADVDTIAGWMIQKLGEMPKVGQSVAVGPLNIEVTEVDRHRISKVRVVLNAEPVTEVASESP